MKGIQWLMVFAATMCFAVTVEAASITGTVKYEGEVPNFRPIKMAADPICLTHHTEEVFPQALVLGEGQTLGNVFVYIKNAPKGNYPVPTEAFEVTQKGCMYDPHVFGVRAGQPVKFLNPDGTLHNVHALSKVNPEFNLAMPKFRTELTKTFDKAEFMFQLKCDVHPWMGAYMSVMEHPFFGTTAADGQYTISDLPAGEYEVAVWHEKLGEQTSRVKLEGDTANADFTFTRPDKN